MPSQGYRSVVFWKKIIITIRDLYLLTNARAIPIIILIKEKLCDITVLMYPEGKCKGQLWAQGPGGGRLASETYRANLVTRS